MYSLELSPAAARDYKKLPVNEVEDINRGIEAISNNPRLSGYKKLKNRNAYRIRVNDYRIIYEIKEKSLTIVIIRVRHRKEVYRNL
jgi:mRNA interferase RelE/StbE